MSRRSKISIHPTAIIDKNASISQSAIIGPYCVVSGKVVIDDDVELKSHVCVDGDTVIGNKTVVYPFATIGFAPQDLKYSGEKSRVRIGSRNVIREYVTVHAGTFGGRMETTIGNDCLLMVCSHVAHDCVVGNSVIMANNATIGGHVEIGDMAIIGGVSAIHQFVRIGKCAVIGGMSGVERDVIPYGAVKGDRAYLSGLNLVGLRRNLIDKTEINSLRHAYEELFLREENIDDNIVHIAEKYKDSFCVKEIIDFMKKDSKRMFCVPKIGDRQK